MQIQNIQSNSCNFQGKGEHLPKTFAGMMNKLYNQAIKQLPDTFENSGTIKLSVGLENGETGKLGDKQYKDKNGFSIEVTNALGLLVIALEK